MRQLRREEAVKALKGESVGGIADDLLRRCNEAMRNGEDFPTVWQTLLRGHRLVLGIPVQQMEAGNIQLHIRLLTGQELVFNSSTKTFSLL